MSLSLDGAIIHHGRFDWLIEKASDLDSVFSAIVHADVTGSVGASEDTTDPSGKVTKWATVHRLTELTYTTQGVYGAQGETTTRRIERRPPPVLASASTAAAKPIASRTASTTVQRVNR